MVFATHVIAMFQASALCDRESIEACLADLRAHQEGLDRYIEESFRELDALHTDLEKFYQELVHQEETLERARAELEHAQREREMEREAVDREQIANLEQLEQQYQQAQQELESLRLEVADRDPHVTGEYAEGYSAEVLDLQQQREELEAELETVRTRAAELSDALDEAKRQSVEDRAEWSTELKQMRRILERQSELLATAPTQPVAAAAVSASPGREKGAAAVATEPAKDPVLGSVMAQFEKIRKERAQRRMRSDQEEHERVESG